MKHISNLITTDSSRQYNIERLCEYTIKDESVIKRTFLDIAGRFVGGHYRITEDNRKIINELLMYFTGNGNLNLRKGIYIYGDFGTGKSVMMQAIRKTLAKIFPFNLNGFGNTSIEQIIEHYKFENNLHKFGYNDGKPYHLCINEFGKQMSEKIYGTDVNNILESLFMIRYELFQSGKLTHVTSNYSPDQVSLPPIIKDRMVEMFNFINLGGNSFRK